MASLEPKTRTVLEPHAEFDFSNPSSYSIQSLAISTVSDSQTLIYVGTQAGALILLSSNPSNSTHNNNNNQTAFDVSRNASLSQNVSLLRSVSVSDSSVDWIHVLAEGGKVLVLCDGFLFLIDMLLLQPVKKLNFVRGVSVIARRLRTGESGCSNLLGDSVNLSEFASTSQRFLQKLGGGIRVNGVKSKESEQQREGNYVFAVVVGKKLVLTELILGNRIGKSDRDMDSIGGAFVVLKEIQCVDGVKTMVWVDDSIIVGTLSGYTLISCVTGQSGLIFSLPDPSSPPQLKLLWKEHKVLLLVDNVGIIANAHGQPVGGSLLFRRAPDSVGEISSYLIVVRDGKMELYHKKSGTCIQTVSFSGDGVGTCVVADEENGRGKLIAVATPSKVM